MGLTRAEQETIFRWDEEEQLVHVYSASPKSWRKLARLGLEVRKETTYRGAVSGRFYKPIPAALFRWGLKRKGGKGNPDAFRRPQVAPS